MNDIFVNNTLANLPTFDLSFDAQWMEDRLGDSEDAKGVIVGLRLNTNF